MVFWRNGRFQVESGDMQRARGSCTLHGGFVEGSWRVHGRFGGQVPPLHRARGRGNGLDAELPLGV